MKNVALALLWVTSLLVGCGIALIGIAVALHDGGAAYNCARSGLDVGPPPVGDLMGTVDGHLSLFPIGLVCTFGDGAGSVVTVLAGNWFWTTVAYGFIALGLIGATFQGMTVRRPPRRPSATRSVARGSI